MRAIRSPFVLVALLSLAAASLVGCGDGGPLGGGGVAGKYELDKPATAPAMEKMLKEQGAPPEVIKTMVDSMRIDLTLKGDKTWEAAYYSKVMDRENKGSATGTWSQDGDKVTMVTKTEDGKPSTDEDPQIVEAKGGRLTMDKDGVKVVLKKR